MALSVERILNRLGIEDPHFVEIESKRRVQPEQAKDVRSYLLSRKRIKHKKEAVFFDQFLDTPRMALFKRGASMRIRYKGNGSRVYLQYKGPGFHRNGLLYRSEFSTARLRHMVLEESHHDIVHFNEETVQSIMKHHLPPQMAAAMRVHLGARVMKSISQGPIICLYKKDKFWIDYGNLALEPSLDRVFTFHITPGGLHPLSAFCEYENEIKSRDNTLASKLKRIGTLIDFDSKLAARFGMPLERYDKYHRCGSFFLPNGKK